MNGFDGGPVLDSLARTAADSRLGVLLLVGVSLFLLLWRRNGAMLRLVFVLALAVGVTDFTVGKVLKPMVARPRPCHVWSDTVRLRGTTCGGLFGMPSNHAANNAAIAAALYGHVPGALVVAYAAFAAFIGWSRVYVGAHYPGDVLVGLLFGALVGWACRKLVGRFGQSLQRPGSRFKLER